MPKTATHRFRKEKGKQMFAYCVRKDEKLCNVGKSRRPDCKTINDLHGDGDMSLVDRYPLWDEIVTEEGFMTRESYLEIKGRI